MTQSKADVHTASGIKYLQQLGKHWSHKMVTEFDPKQGRVDFPPDAQLFLEADQSVLRLKLESADDSLERIEGVVADHLKRFAFREKLTFDWAKAA